MYRDPEAASPGKRGPARAGAPRTGWGAPHRRVGRLQRLGAVSEPQPGAAVGWSRTNCTPFYQGHLCPGGVGSSGRDSDSHPAVGTFVGWMPGADFAVSPQRPPPQPPAAQGQRVWRSEEVLSPWEPGSALRGTPCSPAPVPRGCQCWGISGQGRSWQLWAKMWAQRSGVSSAVPTVN